ncbi:hypothetical protein [Pseudomonas fluorescens]|uniref:hypothetical protein n=1 Tax=Pseudomonas fluorescens TaxID=294 RepID=UPI00155D934E|nr:hypothetical protein [Pseudomonas fluorescens]
MTREIMVQCPITSGDASAFKIPGFANLASFQSVQQQVVFAAAVVYRPIPLSAFVYHYRIVHLTPFQGEPFSGFHWR